MDRADDTGPSPRALDAWPAIARHAPLGILVDLDGTLIPFADRPEHARPGAALVALLHALSLAPRTSIAVVSGRPRASLEEMFAGAPGLRLVAEHGGWLRDGGTWRTAVPEGARAMDGLAAAFETIAARFAGAWVERKTWSVGLHYRAVAAPDKAALVAQAGAAFEACPARRRGYERLDGSEVLEIRPAGVRKSAAVPWMREKVGPDARLLAIGDDVTDEDMFRALDPCDEAIHVGRDGDRATAARWRLPGPEATQALLRWILAAREDGRAPPPPVLPSPVPMAATPASARAAAG